VAQASFPLPANEQARLRALRAYEILDTLPESSYDDFAQLASIVCDTPIAMISLVDDDRQWFKAKVGLTLSGTPRGDAFCAHAIMDPGSVMIVKDAHADDRFAQNALVLGEPHIRFYAGAPLVTADGDAIGTLCVVDTVPRDLTPGQTEALRIMASEIVSQLDLRKSFAAIEEAVLAQVTYVGELEESKQQLEEVESHLIEAAMTDPLTGLPNRRALEHQLKAEHLRAQRYGTDVSIVMIDVDHFKDINDSLGHPMGDAALVALARLLEQERRGPDVVARYGGEEFLAILPSTSLAGGLIMAERFRRAVERASWDFRTLTISAGVASGKAGEIDPIELVRLADEALLQAKKSGRNCIRGPADLPAR
jgi:diguanylate cyclase (GGDEF)-like protein